MKFAFSPTIFYKLIQSSGFPLVLSLFLLSFNIYAADLKITNYQQCWKFETDKLTNIPPTANSNNLIFTLSDATLISLDSINGSVNWRAELGGEIVTAPISNGKVVIAVTRTALEETKKNPDLLTIRALSLSTGLTIWQKNIPNTKQVSLVLNGDALLLAANQPENGASLINLEIANGNTIWSKNISNALTTGVYRSGAQVYFGTNDNSIYTIRVADGKFLNQYKIKNSARNNIVVADGIIYFGDVRGDITALRENDSRRLWSLRTGGAVQDILPTSYGLLVTSLDNFVYLHKYSNGEREWRRRLAARPLSAALLNQETAILLANGESSAIVLELKKGKILNQVQLGVDNYAVAKLEINNKLLFIPTFYGILCFAPDNLACKIIAEPEKEKSAKRAISRFRLELHQNLMHLGFTAQHNFVHLIFNG